MNSLAAWGWDPRAEALFADQALAGLQPARVVSEERNSYTLRGPARELTAAVSGRFRQQALAAEDYPAVGDWVAVSNAGRDEAQIQAVLPRRSRFARPARGDIPGAQVVAANIDLVFVVAALDHDFKLRRLERYVALAWSSGAEPVILLNKADVCDDVGERLADARAVAPGVPVYALSARAGEGLAAIEPLLEPGRTIALIGSSGVGKSTLVNALLGWERQQTREVRADDQRGRHTTTRRELVALPSGGLLLDSPGLRAVGMWEAEHGIEAAFADIEGLAAACRFSDCGHAGEPGCAVQAAIAEGTLDAQRLDSQRKLERELAALEQRRSAGGRAETRRNGRRLEKLVRSHMRAKYGPDAG